MAKFFAAKRQVFLPYSLTTPKELATALGSWDKLYFLTQKLSWNFTNKFPVSIEVDCGCTAHVHCFILHDVMCTQHNSFVWEGLDGSRYEMASSHACTCAYPCNI